MTTEPTRQPVPMPHTPHKYVGVVLAGGSGTRMGDMTKVTNKHLLPVGDVPMIYHPLRKLVRAGVTDIMVVTGTYHMGDIMGLLGSGSAYGCNFTYRVQDEAGGIAQALALCEKFCCGDAKPVVVLGDNVFADDLDNVLRVANTYPNDAVISLKKVPDPERYGVAVLSGTDVMELVEKPDAGTLQALFEAWYEARALAVAGIYVYPNDVFDVIRTLKPSGRGELEITDVNKRYLDARRLTYNELRGFWTDAGTPDSRHRAERFIMEAA